MEVEIRTTVKYKNITLVLNDELPEALRDSLEKLFEYACNKYKNPGPASVRGCLYEAGLGDQDSIELFKLFTLKK